MNTLNVHVINAAAVIAFGIGALLLNAITSTKKIPTNERYGKYGNISTTYTNRLVKPVMFSGCANSKRISISKTDKTGKTTYQLVKVQPYGMFEADETVDGVEYSLSIGNVIWAIIFVETIVIPIIIVGWYLFEPDGLKPELKN